MTLSSKLKENKKDIRSEAEKEKGRVEERRRTLGVTSDAATDEAVVDERVERS